MKLKFNKQNFFTKQNNTKLALILGLILCLLNMPYWYYQMLRIFGTIGFIYLAYLDYELKIKLTPQIFIGAALILNPIVKISFDRNAFQIIDIILATMVFFSFFQAKIYKKLNIKF